VKVAVSFLALVFSLTKSPGGATDATISAHPFSGAPKLRHISVFPKYRTFWRTVVRDGIVQLSSTLSPLRTARRSDGGLGTSSDGGSGGPIEAQPVQIKVAATSSRVAREMLIGRATEYTREPGCSLAPAFHQPPAWRQPDLRNALQNILDKSVGSRRDLNLHLEQPVERSHAGYNAGQAVRVALNRALRGAQNRRQFSLRTR
jgi:hypothetical protein